MQGIINRTCQNIYEAIVVDSDDSKDKFKQTEDEEKHPYQSIENNMMYYGAVEKDFSTIIDPMEAGSTRFWRLINYFWSAYFVIFKEVCRGTFCDKKQNNDCYKCVLADLGKAVHKIYNEYDYSKADLQNNNYYLKIKNEFKDCVAITTNYTPFVEHYFKDKSIYLSGKLCDFEYPCELSVRDIRDKGINDNDFIFPFLMTQAPVKPIISQSQIEAYWRAISALKDADVLVVIGYSLCKEDNHINALLREAVLSKKLKFIYCDYASSKERFDYEVSKDNILNRLKLNVNTADAKEAAENVVLLENTGDVDTLIKKIYKIILPVRLR